MQWSFGDDADMERELVDRILPSVGGGYNLDVTIQNGTNIVTGMSRALDTTMEVPCRLRSVDWDGWVFTFECLDTDYEPTNETFEVSIDDVVNLHVC